MPPSVIDLFEHERQSGGLFPQPLREEGRRLPKRRLRVLTFGTSETNRRRNTSNGLEHNVAWAQELRARYKVMGYWPAALMHRLDRLLLGLDPYPLEVLESFCRSLYLFERNRIYRYRTADLWNVAMPGGNSRSILHLLSLHQETFAAWRPDLILLCPGMGDRSGTVARATGQDLLELGEVAGLRPEDAFEFEATDEIDAYQTTLEGIEDLMDRNFPDALRAYLGVFRLLRQSRRNEAFTRAIEAATRGVAWSGRHAFVSFEFMTDQPELMQPWLLPDLHPTDEANAKLAESILEQVGDALVARADEDPR